MRVLGCPTCRRNFKPTRALFCCVCKKLRPHYDPLANRLRGGNNYYECAKCGCETSVDSANFEHERFKKDGEKYVRPESY